MALVTNREIDATHKAGIEKVEDKQIVGNVQHARLSIVKCTILDSICTGRVHKDI